MKKLTVYPDPRALAVLGTSAPALNQALECWANVMAKATLDNSKSLGKEEWGLLADIINGTLHEPIWGNPGELLAGAILSGNQDGNGSFGRLIDDRADLIDFGTRSQNGFAGEALLDRNKQALVFFKELLLPGLQLGKRQTIF